MVAPLIFMDAAAYTRSSTTISHSGVSNASIWSDKVLFISCAAQAVSATTVTFSGIPGTMTTVANSSQSGITQVVAWEYVDMTSNPYFGTTRSITTDNTGGGTAGWMIAIPDPSSITGWPVDKRNDLRGRAA